MEFYVILYRGNQTSEPIRGSFEKCTNWMAQANVSTHWQEWELKSRSLPSQIDFTTQCPLGSISKSAQN